MANGYGNGSVIQLDKGKDGKKPKNKCRKWRLVVSLGRDPRSAVQSLPKDADEGEAKAAQDALTESSGIETAEEAEKPKRKKPRYVQKAMNFQGTYTEA